MSAAIDSAWRAVQESPDELSRLEVLADLLLQTGDSFGELIRLELERERNAGDTLSPAIERHRARIASELRHDIAAADWRRGFVRRTSGVGCSTLERCLAHSSFRLLRSVEWAFGVGDGPGRIDHVFTTLPPTVLELRLTGTNLPAGSIRWPTAATRLEVLVTNLPISLEGAQATALRSLHFHPFGLEAAALVASLESLWVPRLTELAMSVEPTVERWPTSFLAGGRCPALKRLSLSGALMPQHLEDLASSGLLRGLEELFLDVQHLDQFDEILSDTADRFDHLKRFRRPVPR
jgi:hypothetical protein